MAFQFPDPTVTPEFTGDNGITYSWDATDGKWVIKGFYASDKDSCLKLTNIGQAFKDYNNPAGQIIFSYYTQGPTSFSEIRIANYSETPDPDKNWLVVNDVRYEAKDVMYLSGDPIWVFEPIIGNLRELYEGVEVTVHNCEPCDKVCKQYVDQEINNLQDQINKLNGVVTQRATLSFTRTGPVEAGEFMANSEIVGLLDTLIFAPGNAYPQLKVDDDIMITGMSLGGRITCTVTEISTPGEIYKVSINTNANTFEVGESYLVAFTV